MDKMTGSQESSWKQFVSELFPPSLYGFGFLERFQILKLFEELGKSPFYEGSIEMISDHIVIGYLEPKQVNDPNNWYINYFLGDRYCGIKDYSNSIKYLSEAYRIRSYDIRSTFALASVYRILSRAKYKNEDLKDLFPNMEEIPPDFDPKESNRVLEELGFTVDQVAQKAIKLFEEMLQIGVRANERGFINTCLDKMRADFPNLEFRAKNLTQQKDAPIKEPQKGPDDVLNNAYVHYKRMLSSVDDPPNFRKELGMVILISLSAILLDPNFGDAYVLLANAYFICFSILSDGDAKNLEYLYRAAAVIQQWADSPLSQYPHTKNFDFARQVYSKIASRITGGALLGFPLPMNEAKDLMKKCVPIYLEYSLEHDPYTRIMDLFKAKFPEEEIQRIAD
jgi:hypothetical protein